MKRSLTLFAFVLVCVLTGRFAAADAVLETDTFRYVIDGNGNSVSFFDKTGETEYLRMNSPCALAKVGDKTYPASSARLDGEMLTLTFGGANVSAEITTTPRRGAILFEIAQVDGEPDELIFVNVPLNLEAKPYEPFAACAMALTPQTHVDQLPALQTEYWAHAVRRYGLVGAKAAMIGVPQSDVIPTIREVMTRDAADIPLSDKGGAWALESEDGYGSYLMNFGSLNEETADSWIESCRRLGFNQIDNHGGSDFIRFGSLDNVKPGGWDAFKRVIDKCHEAGIRLILHTYSCYISPNDRYITPIPHPDLDTWRDWTLAEAIDEAADEIAVTEPIGEDALRSGWTATSRRTLRLGDEIVEYSGITKEAPWKFLGCKRGFHGTHAAAHEAGSAASLLKTYWSGLYLPKLRSPLWHEIAKNHADIANQYGFDGIYFDAIDGLSRMWGPEDYWYYSGEFVMEVARNLDRPVGMEFSHMIHPWWHYRSRYQAWDSPNRGYKRFLDIHLGMIKGSGSYQRDSEIDKYAASKAGKLYLPFQLGWWKLVPWGDPKNEPTYRDVVDYIGCKLVGNDAGFSFNHPVDTDKVDADPFLADCVAMLRDYAEARRAGLDESVLEKLRQPGKEFKLYRDADGAPRFREMFYRGHKIIDITDASAAWEIENEFDDQPFSMRLTALYTPKSYEDSEKGIRFDPTEAGTVCAGNRGVTGFLEPETGRVPATGETAFAFTASNTGEVPDYAAWIQTKPSKLAGDLDPEKLQATGFWIRGDGQGEILNVQVGSCCQMVTIDFTGWRYISLLEADSSEVLKYNWPPSVCAHYPLFRETGDMSACRLWYNNIPAGKTVRCLFGPIAALGYGEYELENPAVTINGETVRFPTALETGSYFELCGGHCVKYNSAGAPVGEFEPKGTVPTLKRGENRIQVTAEPSRPTETRMELTVIGTGKDLE